MIGGGTHQRYRKAYTHQHTETYLDELDKQGRLEVDGRSLARLGKAAEILLAILRILEHGARVGGGGIGVRRPARQDSSAEKVAQGALGFREALVGRLERTICRRPPKGKTREKIFRA